MDQFSDASELIGRTASGRRLIAVVYMDVVGYSHLIGLDDVGTIAHLQALRERVIDPAVNEHGGRVVQTAGDSLLIIFDSIDGAISCAIKMQQEVPLYDGTLCPSGRMRFRIGVNIGDVIASGTDLHGDGVNVAVRLQSVCPEGGVCVSRVVRDHMRDIPGVTFEELGPLHLKNIARPVEALLLHLGMQPDVDHWGRAGTAATAGRSRTLRWSRRLAATAAAAALAVCLLLVVGRRGTAHEEAGRLLAEGLAIHCPAFPCAREWLEKRALFEQAIKLDPTFARPYAEAAFTYTNFVAADLSIDRSEDLRVAGNHATRAVALAPDEAVGYEARGAVLRQDPDRIEDALSAYLRALAVEPARPEVHAQVGFMLLLLGRPADAEKYLREALQMAPDHAYAPGWTNHLGLAEAFLGNYGRAVELFRDSLSKQSRSAIAGDYALEHRLNLASVLALDGQLDAARELANTLRQQHPGLTTHNLFSSCVCSRSPDFLAGVATLRRGLVLAGVPDPG
jgi:class 3 adenylate cyclase/tetratricopeptide (TPR) repeat protein